MDDDIPAPPRDVKHAYTEEHVNEIAQFSYDEGYEDGWKTASRVYAISETEQMKIDCFDTLLVQLRRLEINCNNLYWDILNGDRLKKELAADVDRIQDDMWDILEKMNEV